MHVATVIVLITAISCSVYDLDLSCKYCLMSHSATHRRPSITVKVPQSPLAPHALQIFNVSGSI